MIGHPKYNAFDKVDFCFCDDEPRQGIIWIVDKNGTYFDPTDVSYDIYVEEENTLYKHINEKYVKRKIKQHGYKNTKDNKPK